VGVAHGHQLLQALFEEPESSGRRPPAAAPQGGVLGKEAFVARIGRVRLPAEPETVALYVADLKWRGRRPATIARKLAAIAPYTTDRWTTRPRPTTTSCGPSCVAPAGNWA
jgi:hypothetical protein